MASILSRPQCVNTSCAALILHDMHYLKLFFVADFQEVFHDQTAVLINNQRDCVKRIRPQTVIDACHVERKRTDKIQKHDRCHMWGGISVIHVYHAFLLGQGPSYFDTNIDYSSLICIYAVSWSFR